MQVDINIINITIHIYKHSKHQQREPKPTSQLIPDFSSSSAALRLYPTNLPKATSVMSLPSRMTCAQTDHILHLRS